MEEESPSGQEEEKNISGLGNLFFIITFVCDVSKKGCDDDNM
jgi:hypothetical protein